ncbi:flavodoxin-dependent (E)-4-hydroxy-3-methylbut-2-enyl-diphosphate synthase [Candidatus Peregrinibacteria bacterium]|nr:flavodoxin-dependent (E)-4-hydroxy-3-methylbut-2-enyl-diphosphate synthase [Candidatus Peregrinibacteria bacterium]
MIYNLPMNKRKSLAVQIGAASAAVTIGGGHPVAIQSMTNTDTADVSATVAQVLELVAAGSELVRVTVNNEAAAKAVPFIKEKLAAVGCRAPLIGDFHFNGHILLSVFPACAQALDKYRINPGNVGQGERRDKNFAMMIECALKYDKSVRIGGNWGSLDQELLTKIMDENALRKAVEGGPKPDNEVFVEALAESVLSSARRAQELGMPPERMVLSVKTSEVAQTLRAYRSLAEQCDLALHLGLTEAGSGAKGLISSTAALAVLLEEGIGDTIRYSLTPSLGEPRAREAEACKILLQSLGLRQFQPSITSCPGCGRAENTLFQSLTARVNEYVIKKIPDWTRKNPGAKNLKIAVMGCVVNGPGEAGHADIALCLPGRSESPIGMVYIRGKFVKTLRSQRLGEEFLGILDEFIGRTSKGT